MASMSSMFQQIFGVQFVPSYGMVPRIFKRKYHAYSSAFWNSVNRDKLEKGDKIVLPASALDELSRMNIQFPIMFQITHVSDILPKISHCSVMEFTAPEGEVYLPLWMIDNLGLDPAGESVIELTTVSLPKGEFVQFQAHETKFAMLSHPRVVLENALRLYSCLTVGDTIPVEFNGYIYKLDVTDVNPKRQIGTAPYAVSIIETDIRVDFIEPRDYKEWEEQQKKIKQTTINNSNNNDEEEEEEDFININSKQNIKGSYFDQLTASGSRALKLKEKTNTNTNINTNKKENINQYQNTNNVVSKPIRGQSLGFNNTQSSSIGQSNNTINLSNTSNSKKIEEIIGNMRYIYEVDANGNRKLIRRLPIRNLPAGSQIYFLK